jgi:hypothetical protein
MKLNQDSIQSISQTQDYDIKAKNSSKSCSPGLYSVLALVGVLLITAIIIIPIVLSKGHDNKKQTFLHGNSTSPDEEEEEE